MSSQTELNDTWSASSYRPATQNRKFERWTNGRGNPGDREPSNQVDEQKLLFQLIWPVQIFQRETHSWRCTYSSQALLTMGVVNSSDAAAPASRKHFRTAE